VYAVNQNQTVTIESGFITRSHVPDFMLLLSTMQLPIQKVVMIELSLIHKIDFTGGAALAQCGQQP
jgi:hypothetical protein